MKLIPQLFLVSLLTLGLTAFADAPVFTGEAQKLEKLMRDLFEASKEINGKKKTQARNRIESSLDWDDISAQGVGPARWKKLSADNKGEFTRLLKAVIIKTAYGRLDKFWDGATYQFDKIDVDKGNAHVVARFNVKDQSFTLDYYLKKNSSGWAITDIAFEENRYSENIHEQIDAFLREHSFAKLLDKLKKRLADLG